MRVSGIWFVVISLTATCLGQQPKVEAVPPATLSLTSSTETALPPSGGIFDPIRCDLDGNIYFRSEISPLLRIAPDGKLTDFQIDAIVSDAARTPVIRAFALGANAEVLALSDIRPRQSAMSSPIRSQAYWYIVRFNADGHYQSKMKLNLPEKFYPTAFAAFANGAFLISGQRSSRVSVNDVQRTLAVIVDDRGEVISDLELKREPEEIDPAPILNGAIMVPAIVIPSRDGNAYLMRSISDPLVYILSPTGKVLRLIKIAHPKESQPTSVQYSDGKLLFTYQTSQRERIYVTYDPHDGRELNTFKASPDLKGILACYTGKDFTFIGVRDGKRVLLHAGL